MLRIVVQAKGRLNEESLKLLSDAGINIDPRKRSLLAKSPDFPIEVLFLRDDDIPHAVATGVADIGIVGLNEVEEKQLRVQILEKIGFGKCRISLAIPKAEAYSGVEYFNGKRVATSYPIILSEFFKKNNILADVHEISGSVEIAPAVGMADAIFDIVSSGSTLISNGLKEVETVLESEAVLIGNPNLSDEKKELLNRLLFRISAIKQSKGMKYMLINLPESKIEDATKIIPGMKSPTILPLAKEGWCSMHVVVKESELWERIEQLKEIQAEDILVLSLDKIIM